MKPSMALSLALSTLPAVAFAGEASVTFELAGAEGLRCPESSLHLEGRLGLDDPWQEPRITRAMTGGPLGPMVVAFELAPARWEVRLESPTCWTPALTLEVETGESRVVELPVYPVGEVVATLALPGGESAPDLVEIGFQDGGRQVEGAVRCPVIRRKAYCRVPAERELRVRISAEGFAPHYRWDVRVSSGETLELGAVELDRGAVLLGSAVTVDGSPVPEGSRASLVPRGLAGIEGVDLDLVALHVPLDPEGRFQVRAAGGDYLLSVTAEGYARAVEPVRLIELEEAWLRHPLVLAPPLTVSLVFSPPVDPRGEPWRVFLGRLDRYRSTVTPLVDGAEAGYNGWFERPGLGEGAYLLKVLDAQGAAWHGGEVELSEASMPLTVEIGAVEVRGRLTLGGTPLAAELWFGGRSGVPRVRLTSDEEGRFEGILPRSGPWRVDLDGARLPVRRRLKEVMVATRPGTQVARVEIELPANELSGTVEFEDGSHPPVSIVIIEPEGDETGFTSLPLRGTHRFATLGVNPGPLKVRAQTSIPIEGGGGRNFESEVFYVTMPEDGSVDNVRLVLRSRKKVRGRVTSGGRPVPGAQVTLAPAGEGFTPQYTDARGHFETELPEHARDVVLGVGAMGHTLLVTRAVLPDDGSLEIELPRVGGTVTLAREELVPTSETAPLMTLIRDGLPMPMYWLVTWQRLHPDEQREGVVTLPNLAEGGYMLCVLSREDLGRRDYGAPGFPGKCAAGPLLAGGLLHLEPES